MSNEAKFTKGPWLIDAYGNIKAEGENLKVRGVCIPNGYAKRETDANVALIAAAPEMYSMLIQLQAEGGLGIARHRQIGKLLAKARGE